MLYADLLGLLRFVTQFYWGGYAWLRLVTGMVTDGYADLRGLLRIVTLCYRDGYACTRTSSVAGAAGPGDLREALSG